MIIKDKGNTRSQEAEEGILFENLEQSPVFRKESERVKEKQDK